MGILNLVLKKKWFDMISSGEKKEEYREIKPHYTRQFVLTEDWDVFKKFDVVRFRHGYSTNAPEITLKCLGIEVRQGKSEWGAEHNTEYFVIKLGEILSKHNF